MDYIKRRKCGEVPSPSLHVGVVYSLGIPSVEKLLYMPNKLMSAAGGSPVKKAGCVSGVNPGQAGVGIDRSGPAYVRTNLYMVYVILGAPII